MSKIYHGERIVNETIGLEKLKPEVTEQLGGEAIESLTTDGNNLVLTTSNGVLTTDLSDIIGVGGNPFELERSVLKQGEETIDLLPAIRIPFTPREDWPDIIQNHDFTNTTSGFERYVLQGGTLVSLAPNAISFGTNAELVLNPCFLPQEYKGELMVEIQGTDGTYTFNFTSSQPEYTINVVNGVGLKKVFHNQDYFRLHIYNNNSPRTITKVRIYKINSEAEVDNFPSLVNSLSINKTELVVNTNNTPKRVDLKPALDSVLQLPEQLPNSFQDPNFRKTFDSGTSPWTIEATLYNLGNGYVDLGPGNLVQRSLFITQGKQYAINLLSPSNGTNVNVLLNNSNPSYSGVISGGKCQIVFTAAYTGAASVYISTGTRVTYTEATFSEALTQEKKDEWPSLLEKLTITGTSIVADTNNGDKTVNLLPVVDKIIREGSVSIEVDNDALKINLGGNQQAIPLEKFSPYRQKVGRQIISDSDFNTSISTDSNTPLNTWLSNAGGDGWSIANGVATGTNAGFLYQEFFTTEATTYQLEIDVAVVNNTNLKIIISAGPQNYELSSILQGVTTHTFILPALTRVRFHIWGQSNTSAVINSVKLTEVLEDASLTTPDRVEVFQVSGSTLVLHTDKAEFTLPLSSLNASPIIPLEIVAPVGSDYMHYVLDRPVQISSSKSVRNIAGFDYQVVAGATDFPIRNNITAVNTDLATLSPPQISAGYTLGVQIIRTDATKPSFALINING